jgi:hypothetical protein
VAAVLAAAFAVAACARPEQPLLDRFFGASRLRDRTALQAVSTVVFEPREQGIVRTFEVTDVTGERVAAATTGKDVTVEAVVVLPDGRTVQKTLVITMERTSGADRAPWLVTAFRDAAASPQAPRP